MPITWRNVNAPSNAEAISLLRSSTDQMNSGLDAFGRAIASHQQNLRTAHQQAGVRDTDAFREHLASYKSPEELQSAMSSGAIDRFLGGLSNVDADVARNAPMERMSALRNEVEASHTYAQNERRRAEEPTTRKIQTAIALEDIDTASDLFNENPDLLEAPNLAGGILQAARNRENHEYTSGQRDRTLNEQAEADKLRLARQHGSAIVEDVLNRVPGSAQGRAELLNALDAANISNEVRDELVRDYLDRYKTRYELTDEQMGALEQSEQILSQQLQRNLETLPVNDTYSYTDRDQTTLGDALNYLQNDIGINDSGWLPGRNTPNRFQDAIDHLRKVRGLNDVDADDENGENYERWLGLVALNAAKRHGYLKRLSGAGADFDDGLFKSLLVEEYDNMRRSEKNRKARDDAMDAYSKDLAEIRTKLQISNQYPVQGRGR